MTDRATEWCKVFTERLRLCLSDAEVTELVSKNSKAISAIEGINANYYKALNDRIKQRRDELKG